MNSRRTIILVVAIAMAGLAAMGLLIYVRNIEDTAYRGQELVSVWVAEGDIPKGTDGGELEGRGLIVQKRIPTEFAPTSAITNPSEQIANFVAVNDIPAQQIIALGMFAAPERVQTGVADRLEERTVDPEDGRREDMTTFTFNVGQNNGVAGLLEPGDFVNIMTRYAVPTAEEEGGDPQLDAEGNPIPETTTNEDGAGRNQLPGVYRYDAALVYQKAEVLAIGTQLPATLDAEAAEGEGAANAGLVTLAVPPEVAQIMYAVDDFYLTLVSPDYEPWPMPPLDLTTPLLPGERCDLLTPYGPPVPETDDGQTVCELYAQAVQNQAQSANARP